MKKFTATVLIILIAVVFCACGGQEAVQPEAAKTPVPTVDMSSMQDDEGGEEVSRIQIGFSLAGQGAFYDQLILDIKRECEAMNYSPHINTAETAEQQNEQIQTMLSTGVAVIVLDPVDVDKLETALAECETQHVPVVNIIDSINGLVSTLVAPDYISIGKSAGRDAVEIYGDNTGMCMMLKTDYDSFNMQLMTDGFNEAIGEDKDVSLVSEQFCGDDEEQGYEAAKAALTAQDSGINFIFAQSDALGNGALRAIKELKKDVTLVVFGGDMTLIEAATKGEVHSAIFFGSAALAKDAVYFADRFIKDDAYEPPQYKELRIEAAQGDDAAQYFTEGSLYAQIIGE